MGRPVSFPFPIRAVLPPNSAFGQRPLYNDFHSGVDFNSTTGAFMGEPVVAAGAGRVVESYDGNRPGQTNWARLRGTMVRIDHGTDSRGDLWWTRYHMLDPDTNIPVGSQVDAGDLIGHVGNSGSSGTGAHLHFELWKNRVAVNPVLYLTYNPAAFAGIDSDPFPTLEDFMALTHDEQVELLAAVKDIRTQLLGTGQAADYPSYGSRIIRMDKTLTALVPRVTNLDRQLTGADGFTPSTTGRVIDLQAAVASLAEAVSKIGVAAGIDPAELAKLVAAALPKPLTRTDVAEVLNTATFTTK